MGTETIGRWKKDENGIIYQYFLNYNKEEVQVVILPGEMFQEDIDRVTEHINEVARINGFQLPGLDIPYLVRGSCSDRHIKEMGFSAIAVMCDLNPHGSFNVIPIIKNGSIELVRDEPDGYWKKSTGFAYIKSF